MKRSLLKLSFLCFVVFVFPAFAMSMDIAELIDKAKTKESEYENKIGDYVRVEILDNTVEPKRAEITYYGKGVKTRNDIILINNGKRISSTSINDGKYKWTISERMKIKSPLNAADKLRNNMKSVKFLDYLNKNCKIEKTIKSKGRYCYVLSAEIVTGSIDRGKVLMWVDKENYNTYAQLVYDKDGKELMRTIFSDFREICDGVSVPFKTEIYQKKKFLSRVVIKSYKVNQKLSDEMFDASKFKVPELGEIMKNLKEQHEILKQETNNH